MLVGRWRGGLPGGEATGAASHTKSAACRACNWPLVSVAHLLLSSALPAPALHLTRCLLALLLLLTISARTELPFKSVSVAGVQLFALRLSGY